MKKITYLSIFMLLFSLVGKAQNKQTKDQKAIKSMCGCYEVGFNFAETFQYGTDSTYVPSKVKHDKALEWAELVKDEKDEISIQHILIVETPDQPYIVKHWRQDWEYENTDLYEFDHDNKWKYKSLSKKEVAGQWTQRVFQVDDSPRYEGSGSWVHVDGKSYWENTTPAPLPRREYTQRNDYNVTMRTNRHEIIDGGWIHDQDNKKIIREDNKKDILLAEEKGNNTYTKVPDSRCKAAQDYWNKHHEKWSLVRSKWSDIFARNMNLSLKNKVENKALYKYLFDEEKYKKAEEINTIIDAFVIK